MGLAHDIINFIQVDQPEIILQQGRKVPAAIMLLEYIMYLR